MAYRKIIEDIKKTKFAPVYLLMGDESYIIDQICDTLLDNVIPEDLKDFNQIILYGLDTNVGEIINYCRKFPMIGNRQLVMVREAQSLEKIEELKIYLQNPMKSTILVLAYKYGKLEGKKKIDAEIQKIGGVVFSADKIKEGDLSSYIVSIVKEKGLTIEPKAVIMLGELLGRDLKKLMQEIEKLYLAINSKKEKIITSDLVQEKVGFNKEFNIFEFTDAIAQKNFAKAAVIADYFGQTPKENPFPVTLSMIFKYFSTLLVCYWAKDKTDAGLMKEFGFRYPIQVKNYQLGRKNYNVHKALEIISMIRTYDGYYKGLGKQPVEQGLLLKELLYKIMH